VSRQGLAWGVKGIDAAPGSLFVFQDVVMSFNEVGTLLGAEAEGIDPCRVVVKSCLGEGDGWCVGVMQG
jgi:hypothetical protein